MTKEQAIDHLKADIKYWENTSVSVDHLEMAIKALEQQPSDDCVSRQKVKEGMRKYGFHSPDMTITEFIEDELPPVIPALPKDATNMEKLEKIEKIVNSYDGSAVSVIKQFIEIQKVLEKE